jgi:Common central domain of tyrosinase
MRHLAAVALVLFAFGASAQRPVRLSWQEFAKDPRRVQSLRNAVATMRSRDTADPRSATFRRSWIYWSSMHGFFGPDSTRGTVAEWRAENDLTDPSYDPLFVGVKDTTPPDAIAKAVWGQCQHNTDYFFPWHRLYLYYFERVLQEASGDRTLRLPYWDYTNPQQLRMPAEFTAQTYVNAAGQTVANPLYELRRDDGWNAPGTNQLRSADTNIDNTLEARTLLGSAGYQVRIEGRPHGYTHCAIVGCRATVMGAVPYSANDPIFYLHHANIDRLWDCWTSIPGRKNPSVAVWRDKQFSYVNEQGQKVTRRVRNLFDGSLIDYVYEQPAKCARRDAPVRVAAGASRTAARANAMLAEPMMIAEQQDDLAVDTRVARKKVTMPATASLAHPRQFALRAQSELPVVTELILRGIRFTRHPLSEFRVYLERADDPARRALVGTLSLFSDEPAGAAHHGAPAGGRDEFFDATEALRELQLEGTGSLDVNVVIEAEDPDFRQGAGLVIDEIELQVRRDQ